MNNREPIEDEVLLAYAVESAHDLATLERYLRLYPQFAQALIDCSIELEHNPAPSDLPKAIAAASATAAWNRFQAAMAKPAVSTTANPFARLDSQAFHALATELNMNVLLLMRLRDRAIRLATIPRQLIKALAAKLGTEPNAMGDYLGGTPALAEGVQFKSAAKPAAAPQIDFAEAVRTSQLTADQQQQLLALTE